MALSLAMAGLLALAPTLPALGITYGDCQIVVVVHDGGHCNSETSPHPPCDTAVHVLAEDNCSGAD